MSEHISENNQAGREQVVIERAIMARIPECVARLESLPETYGVSGEADMAMVAMTRDVVALTTQQRDLDDRRDALDIEIAQAEAAHDRLCRQLVEKGIVVNREAVQRDALAVMERLGALRKEREQIFPSRDQCQEDMVDVGQGLDRLKQQRQKVRRALGLVAQLDDILKSLESIDEIAVSPLVNPHMPIEDYMKEVEKQPRNASVTAWSLSVMDDAMERIALKRDAELREAAAMTDRTAVFDIDDNRDDSPVLSAGMFSLLKGDGAS